MDFILANTTTGRPLNDSRYINEASARASLARLGAVFERMYVAIPDFADTRWHTALMEGLRTGDLEGILLPQFTVDVYVPSDADTDNIVAGFLIKGVPEAVFPFKNYCSFNRGVKKVDYGDSDTMPHTSIVYVEFDREQLDIRDFNDLIDGICRLAKLNPDDLSVSFPNSNKVFPYSPEMVKRYFSRRNVDRNRLEQWKANNARAKQLQKEIEHEMQQGSMGQRLGGVPQTAGVTGTGGPHSFQYLKHPNPLRGGKKDGKSGAGGDIPETIKASIQADAQRNRVNHQLPWKDFDNRWAQRLRVAPNRIASIRKKIYS